MLGIAMKIKVYDLTITEITAPASSPKYQYYIGKKFIFGADNQFTKEALMNMYRNGYFDNAIKDEWKEI